MNSSYKNPGFSKSRKKYEPMKKAIVETLKKEGIKYTPTIREIANLVEETQSNLSRYLFLTGHNIANSSETPSWNFDYETLLVDYFTNLSENNSELDSYKKAFFNITDTKRPYFNRNGKSATLEYIIADSLINKNEEIRNLFVGKLESYTQDAFIDKISGPTSEEIRELYNEQGLYNTITDTPKSELENPETKRKLAIDVFNSLKNHIAGLPIEEKIDKIIRITNQRKSLAEDSNSDNEFIKKLAEKTLEETNYILDAIEVNKKFLINYFQK